MLVLLLNINIFNNNQYQECKQVWHFSAMRHKENGATLKEFLNVNSWIKSLCFDHNSIEMHSEGSYWWHFKFSLASSQSLKHCWVRFMIPYGIIRSQGVQEPAKIITLTQFLGIVCLLSLCIQLHYLLEYLLFNSTLKKSSSICNLKNRFLCF